MDHEPRKVIIAADAPDAVREICGISVLERLLRILQRLDCTAVTILSSTPEQISEHLAPPSAPRAGVQVSVRAVAPGGLKISDVSGFRGAVAVIAVGYYDSRLVGALLKRPQTTLLIDSAPTLPQLMTSAAAAAVLEHAWLTRAAADVPLFAQLTRAAERNQIALLDAAAQPTYVTSMRRSIRPVWFPSPAPENVTLAERVLLHAAQNGTLDLPAIVHGPIETWIIARLCRTPITPNQITLFTAVVSASVTALFASGKLATGTLLALLVGVLDGLDGKQARVKVETTPLGQREHALDYVLELSWWTALAFRFGAYPWLALLVSSDLIDRLAKKHAKQKTGRNLDDVAPIDRFVRLIGGRRNIYIWIFAAGLLLHAPGKAFITLCGWGALTAAVHVCRAVWISRQRRGVRGEGASH